MGASEILFTPGFWNKIDILFHVFKILQRFLFLFFFYSFSISGHWYISELLCGFLPSLLPSSPSWNVILSMKYDGELKCPWWSIARLDFYSLQWQKLTNSDIGVPECISPLWLVLSGIIKVWSPSPHLCPNTVSCQEVTSNECQEDPWKLNYRFT